MLAIHKKHGFTLIEILAAMFIFFMLLSTLFGSFRVLSSSISSVGSGSLQFEMAQGCFTRMVTDLEAIFVDLPPSYKQAETGEEPDPYRVEGDIGYIRGSSFSRLRFTSLSHVSFDTLRLREGVAEIIYYVNALRSGEYVLRRSDRLYPYGEFEENDADPIVCRNVQGFTVIYYDEKGEDSETWDSESSEFNYSTPRSIGISLAFGDEDAPFFFSTRVNIAAYREKKV